MIDPIACTSCDRPYDIPAGRVMRFISVGTFPEDLTLHLTTTLQPRKMGSASSNAWSVGRYLQTHRGVQAILKTSHDHTSPATTKIIDLADGVKLVELLRPESTEPNPRFILGIPQHDSLLPDQLLNEIGCLRYVREHTSIPVPQVYFWSIEAGGEYIAREYVEGEYLSSIWGRYSEEEKDAVAVKLAEIIVEMVETRFDKIGGIMPNDKLGPTVERSKILKGRNKFHAMENYNIGPYCSSSEYAHSYLDKEIHYFSSTNSFDTDYNFEKTPLPTFVAELKAQRIALSEHAFRTNEPFVLFHADFHGRNVLVRGTDIVGVIGWGFAGAYPLSEVFNRGQVTVVEHTDDESLRENSIWGKRVTDLVGEMVREKGWRDEEVEWLVGKDSADEMVSRFTTEQCPAV